MTKTDHTDNVRNYVIIALASLVILLFWTYVTDLTSLWVPLSALGLAILATIVAVYTAQLNRRLRREMRERTKAERQLQESREKLRLLLENMEDGVYEVDLAGNFTFFNVSMMKMLNYDPVDLVGMNYRQYMEPEMAKRVYAAFNRVYKSGAPEKGFLWELRSRDGAVLPIEGSISLVRDAQGKPRGFQGVARDIRDRVATERALRHAERLSAVGQTIASVAHTVKNILLRMEGSSRFITDCIANGHHERLEELWGIYQRAALAMSGLVKGMLNFSKEAKPEFQLHPLNEVLQEGVNFSMGDASSRGVTLKTRFSTDLPLVEMDRPSMFEAALDLIGNAIEACGENGGGKVVVASLYLRDQNRVVFSIMDNGPGVPEEIREKIFDPFFTTKGSAGTGLGLANTRKTIEEHQGKIEVNRRDDYTIFSISLPVSQIHMEPTAIAPIRDATLEEISNKADEDSHNEMIVLG